MAEPWQDHLEWSLNWPWPALLVALLLAVAVVVLTWLNVQQLPSRPRRWALVGLRTLTIASLLAVLAQPTWVSHVHNRGAQRIAVLVDRSASMAVGKRDQRRFDRALAVAGKLAAQAPVELHTFGDRLEPARTLGELVKRRPDAPASDLAGALTALGELHRTTPLRAVVIASDGLDTAGLRARNPQAAVSLDTDTADVVRSLHAPVHAVFLDDTEPQVDIAVSAVRTSSFGFTRTFVPVSVDLEFAGVQQLGGTVTLQLSDNGKPMVTQSVPVAGPSRRTIELEFAPLHVGTHVIEAQVVPLPQEATDANNRAYAGMRVVRDRTRVLHLAGHPSWDARFLRTHLRGNPAVDLVSFYVMVGAGAGAFVSSEDTTLIPFPAKEIFEDSLSSFDLLILQDFPYGPFQIEQYMPQVAQYLRGGGALLVLGGAQSLAAGSYVGTPLADLLPVQLDISGDDGGWTGATLQPGLTPVGSAHPAALLGRDADENAEIWKHHRLFGRNTALRPRQGSSVLVSDAGDHPLVAVGDVGEGRSAVVATDSLWTWAFGADLTDGARADAREAGRAHYHRLFDQLTAWLLRDPDLDQVRLDGPAEPVAPDAAVAIGVQVRDGAGQPLPGIALKGGVVALAKLDRSSDQAPQLRADAPLPQVTGPRGEAVFAVPPQAPGAYLAIVEAEIDGRTHRATVPLVVAALAAEASQLQPTDRLLQLLARSSSGSVWTGQVPTSGVPVPPVDSAEAMTVADKTHRELWSRPEVLIWLALLLGVEWTLRRRWGLP